MQITKRLLLVLCACVLMLSHSCTSYMLERQRRDADDQALLRIEVLEDLLAQLKEDTYGHGAAKRRFDGGYGNRYRVGHSVGSKLMALKQAADWNGPGRKKRDTNEM